MENIETDGRTFAFGDIHGCHIALETILSQIRVKPGDTLVVLGDIVDRGPQAALAAEIPMVGDREPVGFIADALHQIEGLGVPG